MANDLQNTALDYTKVGKGISIDERLGDRDVQCP